MKKANKASMTMGDVITVSFFLFGCVFVFGLKNGWDTYNILEKIAFALMALCSFTVAFSRRARYIVGALFFAVGAVFVLYYSISNWQWEINHILDTTLFCCIFLIPSAFLIAKGLEGKRSVSISNIDVMTGPQFESFCGELLKQNGFRDVQVMGGSGDQGVDIIAKKEGLRYAIQCKRYSSKLGNTPVQEVFAGRIHYGCDIAAVMTNNYFTAGAAELARSTGVFLWDRGWISNHMPRKQKTRKAKYLTFRWRKQKAKKESSLVDALLEYLPNISDQWHFTFLCADILESYGFHYVQIKDNRDIIGANLCGMLDDKWYVISCVFTEEIVNAEIVNAILRDRDSYKVDYAAIMTTGHFDDIPSVPGLFLWDYEWIVSHPPKQTSSLEQYQLWIQDHESMDKNFEKQESINLSDFEIQEGVGLSDFEIMQILGQERIWRNRQAAGLDND